MAQTAEEALIVRMEATLTKFERQMSRAKQVAEQTSTGIERRFGQQNKAIATQAEKASGAIGRLTNISGQGRFVLQNTANQIGDIAVQMASGTSASRALAQQLPQMLGGFGALGGALGVVAPLLGTIAAIGIPLAGMFLATGQAGEDLATKMEAMAKAVDEFNAATKAAMVDSAELVQKYGAAAEAAAVFLEALRGVKELDAMGGVAASIDGLNEKFREFYLMGSNTAEAALQVRQLAQELDVSALYAEMIAAAMRDLASADGPQAQADAAARLVGLLDSATGGYENMNGFARDVYLTTTNIGDAAAETAGNVQRAALAMVDFSSIASGAQGVLDGLVSRASALATQAQNAAVALYNAMQAEVNFRKAQQGLAASGKVYSGRGGDPRTSNQQGYGEFVYNGPALDASNNPVVKKGRGSGDSGRDMKDLMREAKRIIAETRTEAEKYKAELAQLNKMHKAGYLNAEDYNRAIQKLQEDFAAAAYGAKTWHETMKEGLEGISDAMASALVNGESLREGLAGVFKSIAFDLAKSGIQEALSGLFSGGSGGGGGLLSAIFGGFRASGGPVNPGKGYIVGENGPEWFQPNRSGTIIPNGAMAGAGGGTVQIIITEAPGFAAKVATIADGVSVRRSQQAVAAANRSLPQRMRQVSSDPRKI